jgi:Pectinacetylesterase
MRRTLQARRAAGVATLFLTAALSAPTYGATYPTNVCVSAKLKAAASACRAELKAWSSWDKDQDSAKRDTAIAGAEQTLAAAWSKAEAVASRKGAECAATTLPSDAMQTAIASGVAGLVDSINLGADFTDKADGSCRSKLLNAAATACQKLLKAESKFVKGLKKDPGGSQRDAAASKSLAKFTGAWDKAACAVNTTAPAVSAALSALDQTILSDTIVSPDVADTFTMITPDAQVTYNGQTLAPACTEGSQFVFFVKKGSGADVNKLLVYYYGGGACWDYQTCGVLHTATRTTGPGDNPATQAAGGFGDLNNPANPFATWSQIAVPYCTGDVHWGNAIVTYTDPSDSSKSVTIHHVGWVNAQVVEKWAREHFVNPDVLFVGGSSAGGYGALLNGLYFVQNVYQASKAYIFDDAGAGVITPDFQQINLAQWGVESTLPKWIPGIKGTHLTDLNIADVAIDAANFYNPRVDFAQYTTAYDQTQTLFYNLMVMGDTELTSAQWWLSTCDWNAKMQVILKAAAPNYQYYIGAGSRHTVWGSDKVYNDTKGGVPLLIDWVDAMLAGDSVGWTSAQCSDCSLEPGDPAPTPLVSPFGAGGVVSCP